VNDRKLPLLHHGLTLFAVAALAILAAGCSSTIKKPTEQNFLNALNAYYSHHNECLFTNTLSFPYEVSRSDSGPAGAKGMDALTESLLMKRLEAKAINVNRYTLTPAGEHVGGRFCYGYREATSAPSFTPLTTENGMQTTTVTYHYKIRDLPIWADTAAMKAAFPAIAKATASDPTDTAKLELTINGWVMGDTK
jgi:hypothetical protein